MVTGRSPGNHGVYDFVRVERGGEHPSYTLTTAADVQCETIWSIASRHGCRVTSLNFPGMFPPPAIDGFVVPGFVPWNYLPRAVRPRDLYQRLTAQPQFNARELAIDWSIERKALQGLPEERLDEWIRFHAARERQWFEIARFLMRDEPCELMAVLFDGIDKLQHVCYHLLDPLVVADTTSPLASRLRQLCLDYFRDLDRFLEAIVEMAGPGARVFMVSDHGFQLAGAEIFYANVWLEQQGHLAWAEDVPVDNDRRLTLDGHIESATLFDWSRTTACALTASSNGIFIQRAEEPGAPGVPAEEYVAFRDCLAESLLEFRDPASGDRVVQEVLVAEEAFSGAHSDRAPDLTLRLRDHSFISVLRADASLKPRTSPYGTHHPDGVFLAAGEGIRQGEEIDRASIVSVAPTILYGLGLPVPEEMEESPLLGAFEPAFVAAHPVGVEATAPARSATIEEQPDVLDDEAEAQIYERLRALGYME